MKTYPVEQLPIVEPMFVRRFHLPNMGEAKGGVMAVRIVEVEDIGLAESRLEYDEPIVDCSLGVFSLTTELILIDERVRRSNPCFGTGHVLYFNGRRWRNHRIGRELSWPEDELLYIGNPIRIDLTPKGLTVHRSNEFLIMSGVALQAKMEAMA